MLLFSFLEMHYELFVHLMRSFSPLSNNWFARLLPLRLLSFFQFLVATSDSIRGCVRPSVRLYVRPPFFFGRGFWALLPLPDPRDLCRACIRPCFFENGNSILTVFLSEFLKKKDTFNNSLSKGILICSQICCPSNLNFRLSIGFFKIQGKLRILRCHRKSSKHDFFQTYDNDPA